MRNDAPDMALEAVETEISAENPALLEKCVGEFIRGTGQAVRFVWFPPVSGGKSIARVGYYILKEEI